MTDGSIFHEIYPACLTLGDELKIYGIGFNGGGVGYVKVGNGPWRPAEAD